MKYTERYQLNASKFANDAMLELCSDRRRASIQRRIIITVAETLKELGANITDEQIRSMKTFKTRYDLRKIYEHCSSEISFWNANIIVYSKQCPIASEIIYDCARDPFISANTQSLITREALNMIEDMILKIIKELSIIATIHTSTPIIIGKEDRNGFTDLTTVGKIVALWLQDFVSSLEELRHLKNKIKMISFHDYDEMIMFYMRQKSEALPTAPVSDEIKEYYKHLKNDLKAATSTQAQKRIKDKLGFKQTYPLTFKSYPQTLDISIANCILQIASCVKRMTDDISLLESYGEISLYEMKVKRRVHYYQKMDGYEQLEDFINLLKGHVSFQFDATIGDLNQSPFTKKEFRSERNLCEIFILIDGILNICHKTSRIMDVEVHKISSNVDRYLPRQINGLLANKVPANKHKGQDTYDDIREHADRKQRDGWRYDFAEGVAKDEKIGLSTRTVKNLLYPHRYLVRTIREVRNYLRKTIRPLIEDVK